MTRLATMALLLTLPVALYGATRSGSPAVEPESLRIGVIAHLSGELAFNGRAMVDGARLAAVELNAQGGVPLAHGRRPIELFIDDDGGEPVRSLSAARRLIFDDEVVALVGPNVSRNAIPVAALAEEQRLLMISPTSTNPETTADRRYVFRVASVDTEQGGRLASFARHTLQAASAAILFDVASAYNRDLAAFFAAEFEESGGRVVAYESYTTGSGRYAEQFDRIAASGPDVLFLPNYPAAARDQLAAADEVGLDASILGSDAWGGLDVTDWGLTRVVYHTSYYFPTADMALTRAFIERYRRSYGVEPTAVAALSYDAVMLLAHALERAGQSEPDALRAALIEMPPYSGVTGPIDYVAGGDPLRDTYIVELSSDALRLARRLGPNLYDTSIRPR